jgi:hypothetical protein
MSQFSSTLIASRSITATVTSSTVTNQPPLPYGQIIVNVSAFTSGSITPSIEAYDVASSSWYTILTGAAISATGTTVLKVGPAITPATNVAVSDFLPTTWRVKLTAAGSTVLTASVGYNLAI